MNRSCIECGKVHDTGLQNMSTGEMIERFDKCRDCIMKNSCTIDYEKMKAPPITSSFTMYQYNVFLKDSKN